MHLIACQVHVEIVCNDQRLTLPKKSMPTRSNDFQKLVFLLRTNLADGSTVTESKMLTDLVSGDQVEVDVCIEGVVGGEPVLICIECRERSRKADKNWVHEMRSKHDRLPTNALILAHNIGFSKSAEALAASFGIKTVTLEEVESPEYPELLANEMALWTKSFSIRAEKVWFVVDPEGDLPSERVRVLPTNYVFDESGARLFTAEKLVTWVLNSEASARYFTENGKPDHTWFEVEWKVGIALAEPLFLEMISPRLLRRVSMIRVEGPCSYAVNGLKLRRAKLGSAQLAWGKTIILGREALVVQSHGPEGATKVSISISNGALS